VPEPRDAIANLIVDGNALPAFSARNTLRESMELVAWLIHHLAKTGRTLSVGDFVTTGSVITPVPIKSHAHLDWGLLGTLQLYFDTGPQGR
jgi:2-keto-4-pentenoate hydratase